MSSFLVFNRVLIVEIQSVVLVFSTLLVNYCPSNLLTGSAPPPPPPPREGRRPQIDKHLPPSSFTGHFRVQKSEKKLGKFGRDRVQSHLWLTACFSYTVHEWIFAHFRIYKEAFPLMTLHPITSEFLYQWGKFSPFFLAVYAPFHVASPK